MGPKNPAQRPTLASVIRAIQERGARASGRPAAVAGPPGGSGPGRAGVAPEASGTVVMGGIIGCGAERVNPQVRFVRPAPRLCVVVGTGVDAPRATT
jgi:hypothetical protein